MTKRRRTEAEEYTPAGSVSGDEPVERSEDVWLEDGNIIVQAENHQFKVHRSVLAKHSPVFADLFKVPQPVASTEPTVEGCPIVELHDTAEDIKHVLLALYGDANYTNVRMDIPFPAVSAMVRLGRKYEIDHLRKEGLARLKLEFPSELEDWDEIDGETFNHIGYPDIDPIPATIKLAHECNLQSILPALYLLFAPIMDGQLATHPDSLPVPYAALRSCVMGRERLMEAAMNQIVGWRQKVGAIEACVARKTCQNTSRRLMRDLLRAHPEYEDIMEMWDTYADTEVGAARLQDLCGPCKEYASKTHEDGRKAVWAAVPTYFQLPAWEDLKDFEG